MTRSSLLVSIDPSNGVIPVNETASGWAINGGGIALDGFLSDFGDDGRVESIKVAALGVDLFKV